MIKSGSSSAESSADLSKSHSLTVTSNAGQAESMAADTSAASGKSLSHDAESHDSASLEKSIKKSSSRWANRPVPVLQVEFPEPWSIIARAASAGAETGNFDKNPKWSGWWDSNPRLTAPKAVALPGCATPRYQRRRWRVALLFVILKPKSVLNSKPK